MPLNLINGTVALLCDLLGSGRKLIEIMLPVSGV